MRAQSIKTGFHRLGLVLAVLCVLPAVLMLFFGILRLQAGDSEYLFFLLGGASWMVGAGAVYGIARAIGWIIAGFVGDGQMQSGALWGTLGHSGGADHPLGR